MVRPELLVVLLFALVAAAEASAKPAHPVLLGVDTAGGRSYDFAGPNLAAHPPYVRALRELGVELVVYHLEPVVNSGPDNLRLTAQRVRAVDAGMRAAGLKYTLNNEHSNWIKSVELEPGRNEYDHPNGAHRWDLRMDWLGPLIDDDDRALLGITYDEAAHMQLTSHQYCSFPDGVPLDAPLLVNTDNVPLERAFELLVGKCRRIRLEHYGGRVQPMTEQVWPDMFHIFARGGWTIGPKLLKEHLSSVVMSVALGAALQYADEGAALWVSPDLWFRGIYPGHSPSAMRSAMLMGYWLGADAVYVENLDCAYGDSFHPQGKPYSLIRWVDADRYELTEYGEAFREFAREYVPAHPRSVRWHDYRPRVAIIRLPDGAWGQRNTDLRDRLLGDRNHPMDEVSAEWLHVWPILTHGAARAGAITYNNHHVYPEERFGFLVPIDSVAVFDHKVTGGVLDSVECFVVCGHALSRPTFEEVARRVAGGARCIISRRLYEPYADADVRGDWIVVESYEDPAVAAALKPYLGPPDVARFRFEGQTIEFRADGDADTLRVNVAHP